MTDERDDRSLVAAHIAGDSTAFAVLVTRHSDRLWAIAMRTLGDREEAADALQDALVSAFRHIGSYRGDAAVTTWLHRVVVNACLDRVRARRPTPVDEVPEVADPVDRPEALATRLELQAALALIPVEQRVVVVLLDMLDRPLAEVAETLGIPPGTVKSRASRGRARLAVLLGHLAPAGTGSPPPPVEPAVDAVGGAT